ncbi:hypothetical protein N7456_003034 [Penicillium angulare]|uniref:Arrestin-like N-terminal domain-containing protein n=1 Tax=Penicillium angulare TaxID=116970 RepID=A0A9W9FTZ8_9EURO|nr:hypothetical protein N7456_003034 [Penicillium angulare]
MVIETTQIRVGDETEHIQRCWIVQTVANMSKNLAQGDEPLGSTVQVPSSIWSTHAVPSKITPTFEICNIKRTYQLEVRLGFDVGYFKVRILVPA